MTRPTFSKGDPAVVIERNNPAGRHGRDRPDSIFPVKVVSVGPAWITVVSDAGRRWRFDHDGEAGGDHAGLPPEIWPDTQAYYADLHRTQAWDRLMEAMRGGLPDHLTTSDMIDFTLKITHPPKDAP